MNDNDHKFKWLLKRHGELVSLNHLKNWWVNIHQLFLNMNLILYLQESERSPFNFYVIFLLFKYLSIDFLELNCLISFLIEKVMLYYTRNIYIFIGCKCGDNYLKNVGSNYANFFFTFFLSIYSLIFLPFLNNNF